MKLKELSLHVLDIVENSISANANLIKILIDEDLVHNLLTIQIEDNGIGMDKELLRMADNPFTTTRKTRKVGLGLSLFKAAALRTEGNFNIDSVKGKGTIVKATFKHDHIDRAPIGNMGSTIATILSREDNIDLLYIHRICDKVFEFDTRKIKEILGEVSLNTPEIILWIQNYINENIIELSK